MNQPLPLATSFAISIIGHANQKLVGAERGSLVFAAYLGSGSNSDMRIVLPATIVFMTLPS